MNCGNVIVTVPARVGPRRSAKPLQAASSRDTKNRTARRRRRGHELRAVIMHLPAWHEVDDILVGKEWSPGRHPSPGASLRNRHRGHYDLDARQTPVKTRSTTDKALLPHLAAMLYLRMLGGLSIHHAVEERSPSASAANGAHPAPAALTGAATQRRPLALLAFLATAGDRGRSRDDVLLHLWPDSTPSRARNVLKQTLYALRRDLGAPDVVLSDNDRLRLNPAVVANDVAELDAALDRCQSERALALYRGPFLEHVSLGGVPEFDRWARVERERLAARLAAGQRTAQPSIGRIARTSRMPQRCGERDDATRRECSRGVASAFVILAVLGATALRCGARHRICPHGRPGTDHRRSTVRHRRRRHGIRVLRERHGGPARHPPCRRSGEQSASDRPSVVLRAWDVRRPHDRVLRRRQPSGWQELHADRIVRGTVVGTAAHLVLSAEMRAAPSGKTLAQASVTGTADSLSTLVDRLAACCSLASRVRGGTRAGGAKGPRRYAADGGPRLRAGTGGVSSRPVRRSGEVFRARAPRDSTFAQAALGLAQSAGWAGAPEAISNAAPVSPGAVATASLVARASYSPPASAASGCSRPATRPTHC